MEVRTRTPQLVALADPELDVTVVGGKAAGLMRLAQANLPVPAGFVVTAAAFQEFLRSEDLGAALAQLATELDPGDHAATEAAARRLALAIADHDLPAELERRIEAAYDALPKVAGEKPLVAVRSSATAEDSADASFAGEYESYLGIARAEVAENVRRCWASAFSGRSLAYMAKQGLSPAEVAMAVVVQTMVPSVASGVAFTVDPLNGDRLRIVIEGSWGLGLSVVGGEVTPDRYVLDKIGLKVVSREIAEKTMEYRLDNGHVGSHAVPAERRARPCLEEPELRALGELAKQIERAHGGPQDIEWAVAGGELYLLQCRPVTVWRAEEEPALAAESLLALVTSSLREGVRVR